MTFKNTITKLSTGAIIWVMFWTLLQAYALVDALDLSWKDALIDAAVASLLIAHAGFVMRSSLRNYQPSPGNRFYLFVWSIALAVLCIVVQRFLVTQYIFEHDERYLKLFSESLIIRGLFAWLMISLISVLSWMWFYLQDKSVREKREDDAGKLAREAELSSLRQQLQPHFLFNSLNSISALAGSKPEQARNMIQQLSDFLRGTIKRDDQQITSLEEELKHLQLYLEIEKVRFGHRLKTIIENDHNALTTELPALLLQPIVENAIKFGLYDTIGAITISIKTRIENNYLVVEVENPFDAETTQPKQGTGFGLNSVQRRLCLLYARNDLLTVRKNENIFTTQIKIPQKQ